MVISSLMDTCTIWEKDKKKSSQMQVKRYYLLRGYVVSHLINHTLNPELNKLKIIK